MIAYAQKQQRRVLAVHRRHDFVRVRKSVLVSINYSACASLWKKVKPVYRSSLSQNASHQNCCASPCSVVRLDRAVATSKSAIT
jgi:hypothetical protein